MDVFNRLEIYIPVEAEVKSIDLQSLPKSVLRRMALPLSDSADSSEGIWICPAVIRMKGQRPASRTGSGEAESMSSVLATEFRDSPGPFRMSFVSSNRAAYKVLKETMPGKLPSYSSPLPQHAAPQTIRDAVVIYRGRIYLSIRKPSRNKARAETREPRPASQSATPSSSDLSVTSQKKELVRNNRPKKRQVPLKAAHRENKKDATHKRRRVSSSKAARPVPQPTDSVDGQDARGEQVSEEAALQTPWFQPQEEVARSDTGECEMPNLDREAAESADRHSDTDGNMQRDGREVDQSSSQSGTRRESVGAAAASTTLQMEVDFSVLEQEEKIARMMAKLRQNEAALNSLPSSS